MCFIPMACLNPQTLREKSLAFPVASSFWDRTLGPPSAALADQLLSEIARWSARSSGRLQEDDMTLIIVDWQGTILSSPTELNNRVLSI